MSCIVEIVGFLQVRKGSMRRETKTVLVLRGILGVQTGVHVVVEKHSFRAIDGWVQDRIRLQVLTVQIHSTRVCAVVAPDHTIGVQHGNQLKHKEAT